MTARFRKYRPEPDFLRIRDLLVNVRQAFDTLPNMEGIRRVAALGAEKVCVGSGQPFYEAIGFWKKHSGYTWTRES
jgi:hypothetical protein